MSHDARVKPTLTVVKDPMGPCQWRVVDENGRSCAWYSSRRGAREFAREWLRLRRATFAMERFTDALNTAAARFRSLVTSPENQESHERRQRVPQALS